MRCGLTVSIEFSDSTGTGEPLRPADQIVEIGQIEVGLHEPLDDLGLHASTLPPAHAKWTDAPVTSRSYRGPNESLCQRCQGGSGSLLAHGKPRSRLPKGLSHRLPGAGAVGGSAGLSTRAIAGATGVSHTTVENDLASGGKNLPDRVTSLDGRSRPASRPSVVRPRRGTTGRSLPILYDGSPWLT
jgi:hypothetical protein